jgi:drug/metabolite transporter (DMT)-like permease
MKHLLNNDRLKGGLILILSMIAMTIGNSLLHALSAQYSAFNILFYKSLFALILLFILHPSLQNLQKDVLSSKKVLSILRAIVGTCGVLFWIPSIRYLSLQDASALSLTSSFFSAYGGYLLLKEKHFLYKTFGLLTGFTGALIIIHPHFNEGNWYYLLPLLSAFCFGISATLARYLALQNQEYTTSFYLFTTMLLISSPLGYMIPYTLQDFLILVIIGLLYGLSQILYVKAYKYAETSYLASYKFLKVPLHGLFGFIFFCEIPTAISLIGTVIIIFSIFLSSGMFYKTKESAKA